MLGVIRDLILRPQRRKICATWSSVVKKSQAAPVGKEPRDGKQDKRLKQLLGAEREGKQLKPSSPGIGGC